jgi:hypothetical protein
VTGNLHPLVKEQKSAQVVEKKEAKFLRVQKSEEMVRLKVEI